MARKRFLPPVPAWAFLAVAGLLDTTPRVFDEVVDGESWNLEAPQSEIEALESENQRKAVELDKVKLSNRVLFQTSVIFSVMVGGLFIATLTAAAAKNLP
eukprot:GHVO01044409.1.p1 GENE.GHVO01044409.1~~GHVO01044409.1.p1  ORF type:complete len:112 (-),score=18.78 GHVO01044409.1:149-448(-)